MEKRPLIVIDVGNTNVACGIFRGRRLVARWRMPTASCAKAPAVARLLASRIGKRRAREIDGACIVSVVPRLNRIFRAACRRALGIAPLFATPRTIGVPLRRYPASQIGPDRLVNALAAHARFRRACIVVDVGTAITIDAVSADGEFKGGAIAPGPALMGDALHRMTAQLPRVTPAPPRSAIGRTTKECIRSGVVLGSAGLIDRIVDRIAREMKGRPIVVATGGAAAALARLCRTIRRVESDLTLQGLKLVWAKNA